MFSSHDLTAWDGRSAKPVAFLDLDPYEIEPAPLAFEGVREAEGAFSRIVIAAAGGLLAWITIATTVAIQTGQL